MKCTQRQRLLDFRNVSMMGQMSLDKRLGIARQRRTAQSEKDVSDSAHLGWCWAMQGEGDTHEVNTQSDDAVSVLDDCGAGAVAKGRLLRLDVAMLCSDSLRAVAGHASYFLGKGLIIEEMYASDSCRVP